MILNSIKIENIRSIKKEELTFPESTILFFGDVGSGKSTVLKAIEFALFGTMGDLSAESLLRRGKNNGSVEMNFTLDGKSFTIYRELKKVTRKGKESITQPKGWFNENGTQVDYSTTELRLKILDLLNYSAAKYKSASKKCIDIYRYTVYTPQEEVKEILLAKPEDRFDILKDVLDIEKYENVIGNLDEVKKQLSEDLREFEITIRSLGTPEDEIPVKKQEIETLNSEIKELSKKINEKQAEYQAELGYQEKLQKECNECSNKIVEIKGLEDNIQDQTESINQNQINIELLEKEISDINVKQDSLPIIELKTETSEDKIESELRNLRKDESELIKQVAIKKNSVEQIEEMLENNKCPLCKQEIHERERFEQEFADGKKELEILNGKLNNLKKTIENNEGLLKSLQEYSDNKKERKSLSDLIKEKQKNIDKLKKNIENSQKKIDDIQTKIDEILKLYGIEAVEQLKNEESEFESKSNEQKALVQEHQKALTELEKQKSSIGANLENLKKELAELENDLRQKNELKERKNFMTELQEWVSNQLPVLFRDIERTILASTARDFNEYFKEWFAELVQDVNIEINIDPQDLQPIVYISGYESPFEDMSGGEKSALSLAYRLALNQIINTKHQEVKTKDILILDEPTDGFSEAQVNKMQNIFSKLNAKQLIIISHERMLDSFVSEIFNFEKNNHKTSIKRESG